MIAVGNDDACNGGAVIIMWSMPRRQRLESEPFI